MEVPQEIEDPSDWLNTSLATFLPVDNALRCQVCKDFYETPMITSCSHTFCSKCIRTCLSSDGKCPTCRSADQASKLRNNLAIEEAVGAFQIARPGAYKIALKDKVEDDAAPRRRPGKRRRISYDEDITTGGDDSRRQTRSMRTRGPDSAATPAQAVGAIEIIDTDGNDEDYELEDGLVACPICATRMKEQQVDPHIGSGECDGTKKEDKAGPPSSRKPARPKPLQKQSPKPPAIKKQDRLAELNYSMLTENALRKKMAQLGLPTTGLKALLQKRYTEWVNLWNANCDSRHPKSKPDLLNELRKWERSQGGQARNADNAGIMEKDFDAVGWQKDNQDDFSRLIQEARKKRDQARTASTNGQTAAQEAKADGPLAQEGIETVDMTDPNATIHIETEAKVASATTLEGIHSQPIPQSQPQQNQTPTPQCDPNNPYENNPAAMSSIREKVRALNNGTHIEPLMNEGFAIPLSGQLDPSSQFHERSPTLLSRPSSFSSNGGGAPGSRRSSTGGSRRNSSGARAVGAVEHDHGRKGGTEKGCTVPEMRRESSLGEHFADQGRTMNMFRVPEEPVSDNERGI